MNIAPPPPRQTGLHVTCQPSKAPDALVFAYRAENQSAVPLFVMDAMPQVDPASRAVSANDQSAPVLLRGGGVAVLGKFIAPLPQDRILIAPDLPLCVRLDPGAAIERELRIPLPFAEGSPYFPDLSLREYTPAEVTGVILAIGFVRADTPGVHTAPAAYAPGLHVLSFALAPIVAGLASRLLPVKKLEILQRCDDFPRHLPCHPVED